MHLLRHARLGGFVYRSAKLAGEGNHFHANCRCRVIPGFEEMAVQGYDPGEWMLRRKGMERIDADDSISASEKGEAKRRLGRTVERGVPPNLSLRFLNSPDRLYRDAGRIQPINGCEDVCIHSDGLGFYYTDADGESFSQISVSELGSSLRESPDYHGGPIRLIACDSGFGDGDNAAQFLANEIGVDDLAPSQTVYVDSDGTMILARSDEEAFEVLAGIIKSSGEWIVFRPSKGV